LKVYTTQPIGKFGDDSGWSTIVLLTLSCGDYQKEKKQYETIMTHFTIGLIVGLTFMAPQNESFDF